MRIDIWYDSDEAKKITNVQEYNDSKIIVWNKGNNTGATSQETSQLNSKKQIAKISNYKRPFSGVLIVSREYFF